MLRYEKIINEEIINETQFLEERLQAVVNELEKLKMLVPQGAKLRSVKRGNIYQYFIRKKAVEKNGEYIRTEDRKTAVILAQIEYDEKLTASLQDSLAIINKNNKAIHIDPFENALDKMSPGKKELIRTHYTSDEIYLNNWKNQEYEVLDFKDDYPEYYTRQGIRVRSKSEVIIADTLDELAIPFLYEKPLKLKSGIVHPDFTLLNIRERRELYWEHLGMMDDIDYRNNAFFKIRNYESSGIYQHDSLILTFETSKYPLNTKEIRRMIIKMKKSLGYDL